LLSENSEEGEENGDEIFGAEPDTRPWTLLLDLEPGVQSTAGDGCVRNNDALRTEFRSRFSLKASLPLNLGLDPNFGPASRPEISLAY